MADKEGATIIKESKGLASALQKLEKSAKHNPFRFGSETSAHIFIVNPFRASFLMKIFSTHPSTEERVKRLTALKF
jgi:heat shock protein HtpX